MDNESLLLLGRLIREERTAALATLRQGNPLVSMVLHSPAVDYTAFYIHISRLAYHTQDIIKDPRVSLMIAETDSGTKDPQLLARVSLRGEAIAVAAADEDFGAAQDGYLKRFPQSRINFGLGDFSMYRIRPSAIRYVAGFGRIFNLRLEDLQAASAADAG